MDTNKNTTTSTDTNEHKPAEWNVEPARWLKENGATLPEAFDAISSVLDSADSQTYLDTGTGIGCMPAAFADALVALLCQAGSAYSGWKRHDDTTFFAYGPMLVPTTPIGLRMLKALKKHAKDSVSGDASRIIEPDSDLGQVLACTAEGTDRSGFWQSIRNRTSGKTGEAWKFGIGLDSRAFGTLPAGTKAPLAFLAPDLDGYELDGDDAREIMQAESMCNEGAAAFLNEHGIGFEAEGGYGECESCGAEHEDDEAGEITSIDDFELTSAVRRSLESAGYWDAVVEHIHGETEGDWDTLLSECDDDEIMERHKPDVDAGISFDRAEWTFVPDFESVEGLEDLDFAEQCRALPLLARIVEEHTTAGILPAVNGTLVQNERLGCKHAAGRSYGFEWDAAECQLRHQVNGRLSVRSNPVNGAVWLVLDGKMGGLTAEGSEWMTHAPVHAAGENAERLLRVHKSTAEI